MKYVNLNPKIASNNEKIMAFCNAIEDSKAIIEFINTNTPTYDKNNIQELVGSLIGEKLNNLCMIKGTKDNKLVELRIENLKEGNNVNNRKFIDYITNYSFFNLGAETVVSFCKQPNEFLESIGYESLGDYDNYITYVKDYEKETTTGGKKL